MQHRPLRGQPFGGVPTGAVERNIRQAYTPKVVLKTAAVILPTIYGILWEYCRISGYLVDLMY